MKEETSKKISASALLEKNVKEIVRTNNYNRKGIRSLADLAKAMEITAPSLTHALKGNPRLDTIEKIADALNVPLSRLFSGTVEIDGYISTKWHILHFNSVDELQSALDPLQYTIIKK